MTFQCDIEGCGKTFSCRKTLKEHERTHTGERPYTCPLCQQTFAQYSSLQKHQRVHDKKKPYKCKYEGCSQAFSQISNLIRHERIHTGEKPYICHLCKKKFASGSNLKQHMQVHNNEESRVQFKCYLHNCHKAYLYVSSLKKHLQIAHPAEFELNIKTNKIDLNDCKEILDKTKVVILYDEEFEESKHTDEHEESLNESSSKLKKRTKFAQIYEDRDNMKMDKQEFSDHTQQQLKRIKTDQFQTFNPTISISNRFLSQQLLPRSIEAKYEHSCQIQQPTELLTYSAKLNPQPYLIQTQPKIPQLDLLFKSQAQLQQLQQLQSKQQTLPPLNALGILQSQQQPLSNNLSSVVPLHSMSSQNSLMTGDLMVALKDLQVELQQEAPSAFQKIQQYVMASTALAMQMQKLGSQQQQVLVNQPSTMLKQQPLPFPQYEDKIQVFLAQLTQQNEQAIQETQPVYKQEVKQQQQLAPTTSQAEISQPIITDEIMEEKESLAISSNRQDSNSQKKFALKSISLKERKEKAAGEQNVQSNEDSYCSQKSNEHESPIVECTAPNTTSPIKVVKPLKLSTFSKKQQNPLDLGICGSSDKTNFSINKHACGDEEGGCCGSNQISDGLQAIQQMDIDSPFQRQFKQPLKLNKKQSSIIHRSKQQIMQFFAKLPCIKTCMTKLTLTSQASSIKPISFDSMEDDFGMQSNAQNSTADCKNTCDAQHTICPEILPTNCDDYFEKKCSCTIYCKKTLKFLQQFVKDEMQIAEIEDLCRDSDNLVLQDTNNNSASQKNKL